MTMKQLLGISLALVMLVGSVPFGFSEPLRVQLEQGIETDQLQCNNPNHVLVLRTNGKVACVTEKTALKTGWEIIQQSEITNIQNDLKTNENSFEIITVTSDTNIKQTESNDITDIQSNQSPLKLIDENNRAFTTLEFPSQVRVGEEFEIHTTWQFFEIDEDGDIDSVVNWDQRYWDETFNYPMSISTSFLNDHGKGIEFTTPDSYQVTTWELGSETMDYMYEKELPFENTLVHKETLKFKIHQIFDSPFNSFYVQIDDDSYYFYITDNQDGTFSLSTTPKNSLISYSTMMNEYNLSEKETDRYDRPIVEGFRAPEVWVCDEECQSYIPKENQPPTKEHWEGLADAMMEFELNIDEIREELQKMNMTENLIKEFLELYPQLNTQRFIPSLSFILPSAFGSNHPDSVYVYGNFMIFGDRGQHVSPIGAQVCAVDELRQKGTFAKLQYNGIDACRTIDNLTGSFGFSTDNKDRDDSSKPADLAVALYLENEVVNVRGYTSGTYMQESRVFEDFSGGAFLGFGQVIVGNTNPTHRAFSLFQYIMEANDFVENKFRKNIDKVELQWEDNGQQRSLNNDDTDYSKIWDRIRIGYEEDINPYPTMHEYGHHVMSIIYESNGGEVLNNPLSCVSHSMTGEEVPQCAWTEGFAEFFPFMIKEVGQLTNLAQVSVGVDFRTAPYIIDMENRKLTSSSGITLNEFPSGLNIEGNIASTLYDIVDGTGEANTDGEAKKYDDLNSLHSEFFDAFDTRPSTGERMPQENFSEFKEDWDKEHIEKLERVMYLNELSSDYDDGNITPPDDSKWNIYFTEDFEDGNLNKWILDTDDDEYWHIVNPTIDRNALPIPDFPSSNNVAVSEDCDKFCYLELKDTIDMRQFDEAKLQLYRFVDSSDDEINGEANEGITVQVSINGGTDWTNLVEWLSPEFDDNTWHGYDETAQNLSLDNYLTSDDFKFRILAKSSSNSEDNAIDKIRLLVKFKGGGGGCSSCPPPVTQVPPVLDSISNVNVNEGVYREVIVKATDTNGDTIRLTVENSPSWVTMDDNRGGNGEIEIDVPNEVSGTSYSVTVKATDNDGSDTETFTIYITEVNETPSLSTITNVNSQAEQSISFNVSATDSDRPSQTLTYSLDGTIPVGASITNSGAFNWTPTESQTGTHLIKFKVTDNGSPVKSDTQVVSFTITEIPDKTAPTLTIPTDKTFEATAILTPLNFTQIGIATATDNRDSNLTITNNAPDTFPLGTTIITYDVSDNSGNNSTDTQIITIQDTTKPVITIPDDVTFEATAINTQLNSTQFGMATASDIFDVTITNDAPSTFPLGDTIIIWTASDSNNNTINESQIITIQDKTSPVIIAPDNIIQDIAEIMFTGSEIILGEPIATDIFLDSVTNNSTGIFPVGDTEILWTAIDTSGNESTDTQIITITESTSLNYANGKYEIIYESINPLSLSSQCDVTGYIFSEWGSDRYYPNKQGSFSDPEIDTSNKDAKKTIIPCKGSFTIDALQIMNDIGSDNFRLEIFIDSNSNEFDKSFRIYHYPQTDKPSEYPIPMFTEKSIDKYCMFYDVTSYLSADGTFTKAGLDCELTVTQITS